MHPVVIHFFKSPSLGMHEWVSHLSGNLQFFAALAIIAVGVLAAAEVTYRMIEVPGISAGQRLIRRLA